MTLPRGLIQLPPANAFLSGQSPSAASPLRYRLNNSLDRRASIRRTSRRLPLTLGSPSNRRRWFGVEPGNDGGFGSLFKRDSLRPGDGAAADWSGMIGDGMGQPVGDIGMGWMESRERAPPRRGNLRRIRPEPYPGVWHQPLCVWRIPRWIARLRVRHESSRWSLPLPRRLWRRALGLSSPGRSSDPRPLSLCGSGRHLQGKQ